MIRDLAQEWAALLRGKPQSALPGFVIDQKQVIGIPKRAWRLASGSGAPSLGAHHQGSSPAIRSRIANRAEKALPFCCVMRRQVHLKRRLQRKPFRVPQPLLVVAEGRALDSLAIVQLQTPNQMRRAVGVMCLCRRPPETEHVKPNCWVSDRRVATHSAVQLESMRKGGKDALNRRLVKR